jgi:hypothetical protein
MKAIYALFLAITILASSSLAKLFFKINDLKDGCTISKKNFEDGTSNEDSYHSTPYGFAIADGIGTKLLSASVFSSFLSLNLAQLFLLSNHSLQNETEELASEKFETEVLKYTQWAISNYNDSFFVKEMIDKYMPGKSDLINIEHPKEFRSGATLLGAYIDNSTKDAPALRIFQKGDVLLIIFRKTPSPGNPKYSYYTPIFILQDQIYDFKFPFQFVSHNTNFIHYKCYSEKILEGDIIVSGTDGFFDNVPVSLITYLVNLLIYKNIQEETNESVIIKIVQETLNKYLKKLDEDSESISEYLATVSSRNLLSRLGRFIKSILKKILSFFISEDIIKVQKPPIRVNNSNVKVGEDPNFQNDSKDFSNEEHDNQILMASFMLQKFEENEHQFFECRARDLVFQQPTPEEKPNTIISSCIESAIQSTFVFPQVFNTKIRDTFETKQFSKYFGFMASFLSSEKDSNFSPFNIKKFEYESSHFNGDVLLEEEGRRDDITVIASLVISKEKIETKTQEDLYEEHNNEEILNDERAQTLFKEYLEKKVKLKKPLKRKNQKNKLQIKNA